MCVICVKCVWCVCGRVHVCAVYVVYIWCVVLFVGWGGESTLGYVGLLVCPHVHLLTSVSMFVRVCVCFV